MVSSVLYSGFINGKAPSAITEGALYVTIEARFVTTQTQKSLRRNMFLLFPVVPDVLHIVIVFHDLDELFHQLDVLFALQGLVVLGNHFDLSGDEGVQNWGIPNFLADFVIVPELG